MTEFVLDETLLSRVGLASLPDAERSSLLKFLRAELELRVGSELSRGLSDAELEEFEAFMDRDMPRVAKWFSVHVPDFASDPIFLRLEAAAPSGSSPEMLLCEFGSLRWLELNCPGYRDVTRKVFAELVDELTAQREVLLQAVAGGADS